MMWPRRPTTWTRSPAWGNSKTVVPSTDVRFDFPSLRIVAIRIAALNFSVTMSRRTEGFAHWGLYLIVWRWMSPCDGFLARAFSPRGREPSRSGSAALGEGAPDCLGSPSRIRGVHDCGHDCDARDAVAGEDASAFPCGPSNRENGEPRTADDRIADLPRNDAFLRRRPAGERQGYG